MEDTTKTQKKPYTPPTMEIVTTMKPINLLCGSGCEDPDDEWNGQFG